jgi:hypothetical protein
MTMAMNARELKWKCMYGMSLLLPSLFMYNHITGITLLQKSRNVKNRSLSRMNFVE